MRIIEPERIRNGPERANLITAYLNQQSRVIGARCELGEFYFRYVHTELNQAGIISIKLVRDDSEQTQNLCVVKQADVISIEFIRNGFGKSEAVLSIKVDNF